MQASRQQGMTAPVLVPLPSRLHSIWASSGPWCLWKKKCILQIRKPLIYHLSIYIRCCRRQGAHDVVRRFTMILLTPPLETGITDPLLGDLPLFPNVVLSCARIKKTKSSYERHWSLSPPLFFFYDSFFVLFIFSEAFRSIPSSWTVLEGHPIPGPFLYHDGISTKTSMSIAPQMCPGPIILASSPWYSWSPVVHSPPRTLLFSFSFSVFFFFSSSYSLFPG